MVRRATANGRSGVVRADTRFGTVTACREQLARDGRTYRVGIDSTLNVPAADADRGPVPPYPGTGRPPTRPSEVRAGAKSPSVKGWAVDRATDVRSVTWREGSKGAMMGRFAAWRVRPAHTPSAGTAPVDACGLLGEWPADDAQPATYFFSNRPAKTRSKRLVATAQSRWRVDRRDRELREELGRDHFEGRSWRGWNQHVVLVPMAYAFPQDVRRRRPKKVPPA